MASRMPRKGGQASTATHHVFDAVERGQKGIEPKGEGVGRWVLGLVVYTKS